MFRKFIKDPLMERKLNLIASLAVFISSIFIHAYFINVSLAGISRWFLNLTKNALTEEAQNSIISMTYVTSDAFISKIPFGLLMTARDEVTIYTDISRPNDNEKHPAIMAMSPYGKEIGSQWLDDTPNHAGIPMEDTSGLQKFEGPDPSYWCNHGYGIINPDVRGAYKSEGVILFFGSDYGRDGEDIIEWAAT